MVNFIYILILVIESGDDLSEIYDSESIVMVNHQSSSDVPIVIVSSYPKQMACGKLFWIMDYIFKFTNFGWVAFFHGDFFILQVSTCSLDSKDSKVDAVESFKF